MSDERDEDDDREAILQRRAIFVASTLAGLALSSCHSAQPCLQVVPYTPDAGAPVAQPCLSPVRAPVDAGEPAPTPCLSVALPDEVDAAVVEPMPCLTPPPDAGAPPVDSGMSAPRPCLSIAVPPLGRPRPCLSVRPHKPGEDE